MGKFNVEIDSSEAIEILSVLDGVIKNKEKFISSLSDKEAIDVQIEGLNKLMNIQSNIQKACNNYLLNNDCKDLVESEGYIESENDEEN